jgi:hypothetical protein
MVSWNLDKNAVVDVDSVTIEMPATDYGAAPTTSGFETPPPVPAAEPAK